MVDVILLISGSSKRMGREKALLSFSKGKDFVCQLLNSYLSLSNINVFIVVNRKNESSIRQACNEFKESIEFVINPTPEKGRLSSILQGIHKVKEGRGAFIQNIDNPFVSSNLLNTMLKNYKPDSFLVPQFEKKNGHPLLLGSALVQEMKTQAKSITDLKSFLNTQVKRSLIVREETILANINSPEEYKKWFSNQELEKRV